MWTAVLLACVGCYALKLAGLSLPERVLSHPTVERVADLIPVALLAALVAVLAAAVALSMVPITAPGVPVLAAGGVAVLVGVLSRRADPTEVPGPDDVAGGHG